MKRGDDGVAVVLDAHPLLDALRHPIGARLSGVLSTLREITGREIVPVEVLMILATPWIS